MPRTYTAVSEAVAVSAIQDLAELVAGANSVIEIISMVVSQESEEGDAQDEMLRLTWTRGHTTTGTGGTTVNANPTDSGDAADEAIIKANNTTQATGGSPVGLDVEAFNVRAGYFHKPVPEERMWLSPDERIVLELPVAPADPITLSWTLKFREYGGT
jgi:hypothetical protein